MECKLCEKEIKNYDAYFNHLKIDENKKIDVCQDCIDKVTKWQQEKLARLFPTKTAKKMFNQKR